MTVVFSRAAQATSYSAEVYYPLDDSNQSAGNEFTLLWDNTFSLFIQILPRSKQFNRLGTYSFAHLNGFLGTRMSSRFRRVGSRSVRKRTPNAVLCVGLLTKISRFYPSLLRYKQGIVFARRERIQIIQFTITKNMTVLVPRTVI